MTVNWIESALRDLRLIERDASRISSEYASQLVDRIFRKSAELEVTPYLGSIPDEYSEQGIREVFEDPYRIFYRIDSDQIDVVAVIHSARRLPRKL